MHQNSLLAFTQFALPLIAPGTRVLEVGPHKKQGYRQATLDSAEEHNGTVWTFCDRAAPEGKQGWIGMPDDYSIDSADSIYHTVLAGQVIEHVRKPWLWVPELARVTRRGGMVVLIGPVSWAHHNAPVDCWRIWPEGYRALFEEAGLEEVLIQEARLDATARDHRFQINPGPVLDIVAVGRKPAEKVPDEVSA